MTAVTLTHKPTKIRVRVETKSQKKNKEEALAILKSRLHNFESQKNDKIRNQKRKNMLGKGKRADKRRTISEKRNQVVDHITGKKMKYKDYLRGFIENLH